MKLCPSWKVYQGWMGCDPFDSIAIPLCEVTVNNVYEIGRAGFHALTSQIGKAAPNGLGAFLNPDFLVGAIGTDHRFGSRADLSPVRSRRAFPGRVYGSWIGGAWPSWQLAEVKAERSRIVAPGEDR